MSFCPRSNLLLLVFYVCLTNCDQEVIEVNLLLPLTYHWTDRAINRNRRPSDSVGPNQSLDLDSYRIYRTSAAREQILLVKISQNQTRWKGETAPLVVESTYRVASVNVDQQQGRISEPVAYYIDSEASTSCSQRPSQITTLSDFSLAWNRSARRLLPAPVHPWWRRCTKFCAPDSALPNALPGDLEIWNHRLWKNFSRF